MERKRESVCVCVYVVRERETEKDGRGPGTVRVWSRLGYGLSVILSSGILSGIPFYLNENIKQET